MEWLWVLVVVLILLGPLVWGVARGRTWRGSDTEDGTNVTGWSMIIRQILTGRGGR